MPQSNGTFYRPIVLSLLGVLITLVGAWAAHTNLRIDKQDERISAVEMQVSATIARLDMVIELQRETLAQIKAHVAASR